MVIFHQCTLTFGRDFIPAFRDMKFKARLWIDNIRMMNNPRGLELHDLQGSFQPNPLYESVIPHITPGMGKLRQTQGKTFTAPEKIQPTRDRRHQSGDWMRPTWGILRLNETPTCFVIKMRFAAKTVLFLPLLKRSGGRSGG